MKKFSLLFILFLFFSCSQNVNEILSTSNTVIFDYNQEALKPSSRLSVFIKSSGDVRRFKELRIYSAQENYEWVTQNLVMYDSGNGMFAGYSNFIVPVGETIPEGAYQATFVSADDEECIATFTIDYDEKINTFTKEQADAFFTQMNAEQWVLIYDENDKVIFFGQKTDDVKTQNDIWLNYRSSQYFYDIWLTQDRSLMCIMPKQQIKRGDTDE